MHTLLNNSRKYTKPTKPFSQIAFPDRHNNIGAILVINPQINTTYIYSEKSF